jgi:hypothetical protein
MTELMTISTLCAPLAIVGLAKMINVKSLTMDAYPSVVLTDPQFTSFEETCALAPVSGATVAVCLVEVDNCNDSCFHDL